MERQIVVVAPTFNEQDNIASFLTAVSKFVPQIVISDSQSSDHTAEIVKTFAQKNRGIHFVVGKTPGPGKLGVGLASGINYAFKHLEADVVITMEADLSNDPSELPKFIKRTQRADLVVGSRYVSGGRIVNWSWWRKLLSRGANLTLMCLTGTTRIHEFTNLYRAFNRKSWEAVCPKACVHTGWLFVPAFVFAALETKLKIVEQPITYFDRFGGRSKMSTVSYSRNLLRYAIRERIKKSASFFKFLVVGGVGFIVNTTVLVVGVNFGMNPANAGALGAEFAIISNFFWNNLWTFSDRKLVSWREIPWKFIQFNVLSFGSAIIQFISLKIGEFIFGLARYKGPIVDLPWIRLISWYMLFYVAGVGLGLIWNYFMYSRVIWKKKK